MKTLDFDFNKAYASEMSGIFSAMDSMKNGEDWLCKEYGVSDMAKYICHQLAERRSYCCFCGTGSGKTSTGIYSSRHLGCKTMVIICPNGNKYHWVNEIIKYYGKKGNRIVDVSSLDDIKTFKPNMYNYIIFNFDKFSIGTAEAAVEKLVGLNKVDFLCIDELHNLKVRYENNTSNRHELVFKLRKMAGEKNPNMYVLGMTATPHINNFTEVRSLVELVTGESHPEIENRNSYVNLYRTCKTLENVGFRYIKETGIKVIPVDIHINGDDLVPEIVEAANHKDFGIRMENLLIIKKMESVEVAQWIQPGSILFSQYRDARNEDAIINTITSHLNERGLTYVKFTGNMEKGTTKKGVIEKFQKHEADVFIGTNPMIEGVDGLQFRSNVLVMLGYPHNAKGNTQLIGRINRTGQGEEKVFVVRPIVEFTINGRKMSYDQGHIDHIDSLQLTSDIAVDGLFERKYDIDRKKIDCRLRKKIQEATDYTPERENL